MNIYVIATYCKDTSFFGTYSTIKRARLAFEKFLTDNENVVSFEDIGDYCYHFTMRNGEEFSAEILGDIVDAEFEKGIVKDE